jgi:hypothetical protein
MNAFIQSLEAKGFAVEPMGGNCQALVRYDAERGRLVVISDSCGGCLPDVDDWGVGIYAGKDMGAEPIDYIDSDSSPLSLGELLDSLESGE